MAFDDQAPPADPPGAPRPEGSPAAAEPSVPRRRRSPRSWSSPATPADRPADRPASKGSERFDRPISESAWGWQPDSTRPARPGAGGPGAGRRAARNERAGAEPPPALSPTPPRLTDDGVGPGAAAPTESVITAVEALSNDVQSQLALLRATVAEAATPPDASLVTGAELAATIENLGTSLGTGIASLLSDHRALLARDVDAAADRVLDELGQRLRTATTHTVDGVEERLRAVMAKGFSGLGEQLELRLDQLQADVTGLRAVMLEIPDQTAVTGRLDQLAESVAGRREHRLSPAVTAAIERAVAGPVGRLEGTLTALAEVVQDLDERVGAGGGVALELAGGPLADPGALEDLIAEMAALRRRISLRNDGPPDGHAVELDEDPDGESGEEAQEPAPVVAPARRAGRTVRTTKAAATSKATRTTKATKATKAAAPKASRRRRSSS